MGKGYPQQTPNPSAVTAITAGGLAIASTPGTIVGTAPAIKGGDVPKVIVFTIAINYGGAEIVTVTVERDGVAFGSAYITGSIAGGDTVLTTMHWFDATPGKGAPIYRVRAVGTNGGVGSANAGRTISVFNV